MTLNRLFATMSVATLLGATALAAQTPANDPSARLKEVLPADVAERVLAKIADARSHGLPAAALEQRALKFAAKGVPPRDIERSVNEHAERLEHSKDALESARTQKPTDDEIEAGAEAMRKGVDGSAVSALAKSAPSGRSLAVPLFVIGGLIDRGLPSDDALKRVSERLQARASDADLERMPGELPAQAVAGRANRPAETGRDLSATKRPANAGAGSHGTAGGPPAGVPVGGGAKKKPTNPGRKP
jgi:hypothetical protein